MLASISLSADLLTGFCFVYQGFARVCQGQPCQLEHSAGGGSRDPKICCHFLLAHGAVEKERDEL
jgi:hypothetical protein